MDPWALSALGGPASPALLPTVHRTELLGQLHSTGSCRVFSGGCPPALASLASWNFHCNWGVDFQLHSVTSQGLLAGNPTLPHTAWHQKIYGTLMQASIFCSWLRFACLKSQHHVDNTATFCYKLPSITAMTPSGSIREKKRNALLKSCFWAGIPVSSIPRSCLIIWIFTNQSLWLVGSCPQCPNAERGVLINDVNPRCFLLWL